MPKLEFHKMQGTGNDYVCLDATSKLPNNLKNLARKLCDRRFGIGADGLLLMMHSKSADVRMRMLNPNGLEAEMCGNGLRCLARFAFEKKIVDKHEFTIETEAGERQVSVVIDNYPNISSINTAIGKPEFDPQKIPALVDSNPFLNKELSFGDQKFNVSLLSMGNPHAVIFVTNLKNFSVEKIGPLIENDHRFPAKINIEFVEIKTKNYILQRTWERGAGETFSCGTGAAAAAVASILTHDCQRQLTVELLGGQLEVSWPTNLNEVWIGGPTINVFKGSILV